MVLRMKIWYGNGLVWYGMVIVDQQLYSIVISGVFKKGEGGYLMCFFNIVKIKLNYIGKENE